MVMLSWRYVLRPRQAQWWVGSVFSLVGLLLVFALPRLLAPDWPGVETAGQVLRIESNDEGLVRPVFGDGEREYARGIWSSRTSYSAGQAVVLVRSADGADGYDWYVKADAEMREAVWVVRLLGGVFLLIGVVVLALTIGGVPDHVVHTVGGTLGALSFGLPASLVLPGLWLAHRWRPNLFFGADDAFGPDQWLLGGIFTVLGLVTVVATFFLARYQLRHKQLGWHWSWDSRDRES